jgi:hypothetical protein
MELLGKTLHQYQHPGNLLRLGRDRDGTKSERFRNKNRLYNIVMVKCLAWTLTMTLGCFSTAYVAGKQVVCFCLGSKF